MPFLVGLHSWFEQLVQNLYFHARQHIDKLPYSSQNYTSAVTYYLFNETIGFGVRTIYRCINFRSLYRFASRPTLMISSTIEFGVNAWSNLDELYERSVY